MSSTVAAISTPLGNGGIGVIRISGDNAVMVADAVFKSVSGKKISGLKGYTALFGAVQIGGEQIDEAVALFYKGPKSYTGEDVVEISVHGGTYVLKKVLRAILNAGAEPAGPGEFTKRAFLNGKMDLTKAESVMNVISATGEAELKIASGALKGNISKAIDDITANLLKAAASISAFSDYPDEDMPELKPEAFGTMLAECRLQLNKMLESFDAGRILREGIETVIVGKPNVGKSTLMNLLSGHNRSIVTSVAGTTRDVIEDTVYVGEVRLNLADTAGIHKTDDEVENAGVNLARQRLNSAQLVLAVLDSSNELDSDDINLINSLKGKNAVIIYNKSDISNGKVKMPDTNIPTVTVSAKNGTGVEELTAVIEEITRVKNLDYNSAVLANERQRALAEVALSAVNAAIDALSGGQTVDAVGVCIDDALAALFTITGKRVTNEVADEVFRRFCVGK